MKKILGKFLFYLLVGMPVWIPIFFIIQDAASTSKLNVLFQLLDGAEVSYQTVLGQLLQYVPYFVPAVLAYVIFGSSDKPKVMTPISIDGLLSKSLADESINISWKPEGISGSPKNNRRWLEVRDGLFAFKSTYRYQVFTYPVVMFSLLYMSFALIGANHAGEFTPFDLLNAGTLILMAAVVLNVAFYFISFGSFMVRTKSNEVLLGTGLISFDRVRCMQVICKQQSYNSGGGGVYSVYELNFVYDGKQRSTVLNHGGLFEFFQQIELLKEFFQVPLYVADEVMADINEHNEEVDRQA